MTKKEYITISELANALGISHVAVWKRVKKGQINAQKTGNTYVITNKEFQHVLRNKVSPKDKEQIKKAVKRTVKEYGEVLKKLGEE